MNNSQMPIKPNRSKNEFRCKSNKEKFKIDRPNSQNETLISTWGHWRAGDGRKTEEDESRRERERESSGLFC